MASIHPPSGFRDFINRDAQRRLKLIHMISTVYESFGFLPLETPVLENLDVLQGSGGGEENEKLIFKILKRGAKLDEAMLSQDVGQIAEYGLRFDLTLPLSRAVALYRGQIHFPWKVFHIGPVWRAERPQKGRFREFLQCDVDVIGSKGIGAEIEVIQAVVAAIEKVGITGFELRINDRRLIQAVAEKFGFTGHKVEAFAVILDKKDKLDAAEILKQLTELAGHELPKELLEVVEGGLNLEAAEPYHPEAVTGLKTIISTLGGLNLPLARIVFDPSLVRGMGYYTGPVFELRHSSAGYSFGGGGRYDKLIGRFSNQEVPACGFSIGFERLVMLLEEIEQKIQVDSNTIFIPLFDESLRGPVLSLAASLRQAGLTIDVYPEAGKIKNQFKFASDVGYRWVLIIGGDEWASKQFKLKDFKLGSEKTVAESELLDHLRNLF